MSKKRDEGTVASPMPVGAILDGGMCGCPIGHEPPCTDETAQAGPPSPPHSPASEHPTLGNLIRAMLGALADLDIAKDAMREAEERVLVRQARVSDAVAAVAHKVGKGKVVRVGETLYRVSVPRKPRGAHEDPAALWTLEKVEVAG